MYISSIYLLDYSVIFDFTVNIAINIIGNILDILAVAETFMSFAESCVTQKMWRPS